MIEDVEAKAKAEEDSTISKATKEKAKAAGEKSKKKTTKTRIKEAKGVKVTKFDENAETKHLKIGDDYGKSLNDLLTTIQGNNHRSMYEIGSPYDGNKFFVTRNFMGYGVMYRDLLSESGEDNLVGVQIGDNSLFHSANTISTNKGKPRSWKKSIATFAIMYPGALRSSFIHTNLNASGYIIANVAILFFQERGLPLLVLIVYAE
ncbi:NAC domain-containing protein 67-like protein [Tanacetum coccineum]